MKRTWLISLLILSWCCTWLFGTGRQQQHTLEVAFAFSDITGKRLLTADTPTEAAALVKGIFSQGLVLNTRFLKQQKPASDWNGRQTARNFDQSAGSLYQVEGKKVPELEAPYIGIGSACLLVTESFFRERKLLDVKHDPSIQSSKDLLRRVEQERGKKAAWGKSIARIGAARDLILVQFVPAENRCLASIVLVAPDSLSFDDHEAKYDDRVKGFIWRVDTDGINSESFHVLAAFEGKEGIEIALLWDAFEGQNLFLLRSEGAMLRRLYAAYRYWAPM